MSAPIGPAVGTGSRTISSRLSNLAVSARSDHTLPPGCLRLATWSSLNRIAVAVKAIFGGRRAAPAGVPLRVELLKVPGH